MKKLISFLIRKVPRKVLQRVSPPILWVIALSLRGNKVTCPIENKSYRKFLPYGRINPRPNALSPGSLSLERHRLIWLYLKNKTTFFEQPIQFLHIAPEHCFIDRFEKIHGNGYITADIESPLAKVKMDVHQIPFEDNTFDAAMCNHVLEHVTDDIKAMSEIHRVLKPGGWAILQVPFFPPIPEKTFEDATITSPSEREKIFGQDDHVRLYGMDYVDRLKQGGFDVFSDDYITTFSEEEIKRYALPKDEIIYFVRKSK